MPQEKNDALVLSGAPRHAFYLQRLALRVDHPDLAGTARHTLRALVVFVNDAGAAWPSRERLSEYSGLGLFALDAALDRLEHLKILRRRRHFRQIIYLIDADELARFASPDAPRFKINTDALSRMCGVSNVASTWSVTATWLAIASRAYAKPQTVAALATLAGLKIRKTQYAVAELQRLGLVSVARPADGTRSGSLIFTLNAAPPTPAQTAVYTGDTSTMTPAQNLSNPCTKSAEPLHKPQLNYKRTKKELFAREKGPVDNPKPGPEQGLRSGPVPKPFALPPADGAAQTLIRRFDETSGQIAVLIQWAGQGGQLRRGVITQWARAASLAIGDPGLSAPDARAAIPAFERLERSAEQALELALPTRAAPAARPPDWLPQVPDFNLTGAMDA